MTSLNTLGNVTAAIKVLRHVGSCSVGWLALKGFERFNYLEMDPSRAALAAEMTYRARGVPHGPTRA